MKQLKSFLLAVARHLNRLMTCRHDGRGLAPKGPALPVSLALAVFCVSGGLKELWVGALGIAAGQLLVHLGLVVLCILWGPGKRMAEVCVGYLLFQVVTQAVNQLCSLKPSLIGQLLSVLLQLWCVWALFSLLSKHTARRRSIETPTNSHENQ